MTTEAASRARILAVDDNPAVLKLLQTLFTEEGIQVDLAKSAQEARDLLQSRDGTYDLVLSDINMPGETGFDLLEWIKAPGSRFKELPVLLTTAELPEAEHRVKGLAMGAVDYVVRPIDLKELAIRAVHAIETYQQVRSLEESLESSENAALIGRLLAASNHELKNLAGLVKVTADQVTRLFASHAKDAREREALDALNRSVSLLADVTKGVKDLIKDRDPGDPIPVDLSALALEITELMRVRVRPARLILETEGGVWAKAHPTRVKQVLINLILNANEAIEDLAPAEGGKIKIDVTADRHKARIVVTDNGIGFGAPGEEATKSTFEPFSTTKKLRGGQGLGLWLCQRVARRMAGDLILKSEGIGKGAQAILELPVTEAPKEMDLDIEKYLIE